MQQTGCSQSTEMSQYLNTILLQNQALVGLRGDCLKLYYFFSVTLNRLTLQAHILTFVHQCFVILQHQVLAVNLG